MSCSVCERETGKQHNNAVSQQAVCLPRSRALPLQPCLEIVSARLFLKLAVAQTVVPCLQMCSTIHDRVHRGEFNSDLHCLYEGSEVNAAGRRTRRVTGGIVAHGHWVGQGGGLTRKAKKGIKKNKKKTKHRTKSSLAAAGMTSFKQTWVAETAVLSNLPLSPYTEVKSNGLWFTERELRLY